MVKMGVRDQMAHIFEKRHIKSGNGTYIRKTAHKKSKMAHIRFFLGRNPENEL
jgi:hypothetical protein